MIKVSVICNTYNQENYIARALDSFLMQEADFEYEVLVHDDASTDRTAEIIRSYENRHPDIIKGYYQTENKHSKGIDITMEYQYPRAQGTYIAFCEGDDYWIDKKKLQKQYDALESSLEVDMCAHAAIKVSAEDEKIIGNIAPRQEKMVIPVEEVIMGEGGFVATNSLMYRKELENPPMEFRKMFSYDYALQIEGALRGGLLYLPDTMSAYRWLSVGSWTSKQLKSKARRKSLYICKQHMLDRLNSETNNKYADVIQLRKEINEFEHLYCFGPYRAALSPIFKNARAYFPKSVTLKLWIKVGFPFVFKLIEKLRT